MATAIMLNLPEAGHMNPSFPLLAALVQRGERVICYGVELFRAAVEAAGAEYRSYPSPQALIPPAHKGGLFSVMAFLASATEAILPTLLAEIRAINPDYLLIDSMSMWGGLVQQVLQIPAITISSVFVTYPKMTVEQMIHMNYGQLPKEMLLNGIDALHNYFEISQRIDRQHGTQSPNIVGAFSNAQSLNVLFTSQDFHPGGEVFYADHYKFVGPSVGLRAEAIGFPFEQLRDAPLVYISLGTIFNEQPDFYNACFAAFGDMPFQVVMAIGDKVEPATLAAPPANFIVQPTVPQLEILQRAALFITHGGMNSTSEGLLYGVPLIVVPQHGDQFIVASRVVDVGAGLMLPAAQAVPAALKGMAMQVLATPSFKERAQAMSRSLHAGGGPQRAADEIVAHINKLVG